MTKILKKSIYLIFTFIVSLMYLEAQQLGGSISGSVRFSDGSVAVGVSVYISNTTMGCATDKNGHYSIKDVVPGNYVLKVSAVGSKGDERKISVKSGGDYKIDFVIAEESRLLDAVTVTSTVKQYAEKRSESVARMPLKNMENPQVYTVLPKALMDQQLVNDYQSALSTAPGTSNITYSPGGGGVGLTSFIRGFSTYAGTMRNGLGTNFVTLADPYNLENLEVIKGPSGTLFGSALVTYGGLINRVTKRPHHTFKGEVSYTVGSFNNNRITGDINIPINDKVAIRLNGFYQKEKSFQDYGVVNSWGFTPSIRYDVNDKLTFDLDAELYQTDRNSNFMKISKPINVKKFSELNLDPKISYTNNEILSHIKVFNIFAKMSYKFNDNWESQTLVSMANTQNEANYFFAEIMSKDSLTRNYMHIPSIFNAVDIQHNFNGKFKIGDKIENKVLLGVDIATNASSDHRFRLDPLDMVEINKEPKYFSLEEFNNRFPAHFIYGHKKDWRTIAVYLSDVVSITDRLMAMVALRVDFFRSKSSDEKFNQTTASPKFGLVYQPVKDKLSIFANYMNGFENEAPGVDPKTNKQIIFKPEQANQFEIGVKAELFNKRISGTISYYDINVKDIIRPNPEDPLESIQDGTRVSRGVEMDIIANPFEGFNILLGYGYNMSKYIKADKSVEGKRPYGVPKHVGNFWTSYQLNSGILEGLGVGLGGNFQSEIPLFDTYDIVGDGYAKFDASLFYDRKKYRIAIKVNNVTNKTYYLSDYWGQFQPPRNVQANLTLHF
ncbi:TonB-dependent receptor [Porphyromonas pogonae]|uniref:TonB-dependent receptor n=1 Tax=Porphyromonas pogonae TaxID=867595 RepID=UPI002E771E38|nr:TonB-dependent receptor [Porphyromonas pogonae]